MASYKKLMIIKLVSLVFFWLISSYLSAQEKLVLSGYVKDSKSGEKLIGVSVYKSNSNIGVNTNEYGFYSLTLPKGTHTIIFSYIGYKKVEKEISLEKNTKLDIELSEEVIEGEEVVITDKREDENIKSIEMSVNKLDIKFIQKMPALLGEVDIIRSIQLLPGVSTVGEGASGFNVRGGNIDQNLILLDEAPVFNSSHLFGFFSVFNPDAVKDVKLVKGGIPSNYGGRLSSLLDIRMKEGNNKKFEYKGGIGTIFSRLSVEGPIIKDKASFIVAARRSYIDVLAKPFLNKDLRQAQFYFYDLTAKFNYIIDEKNTVFVSGYFGRDVFGAGFKFNWGNATTTVRWNRVINPKLFLNLTAFYSNYDYKLKFTDEKGQGFDWKAKIINYSVKPDFTWFVNEKHKIKFGYQSILFHMQPGNAKVTSEDLNFNLSLKHRYGIESGLYINHEWKINDRLATEYGLRFSGFHFIGKGDAFTFADTNLAVSRRLIEKKSYNSLELIQAYYYPEPRISLKYDVDENSSIKTSYNRMVQYLHLVSNTAAPTPIDIWTISTNNIRPQIADQVALGYFRNFAQNMFETSIEVYYKTLQNILDFVPNSNLLLNEQLEGDLLQGIGRAYGAELYLKKNKGKLTGWVSYTISRTERKTEGISKNEWFPTRFDRPHNLNTVLTYELNKRWSFSANFVYLAGTPATFPDSRVQIQGYVIPYNSTEKRNNFRVPDYHRLDISATLSGKQKEGKRLQSEWVFSVYNVYNRRNPFSIYFRSNKNNNLQTEAVRYSVIGSFVPAVTYNFNF